MASTTGIPERNPNTLGRSEEDPLLGGPGDASQQEGKPLYYNLVLGTGVIAQAGLLILFGIVWGAVFSHKLILFSAHPLLNSTAILVLGQGALILQPTHTPQQKRAGTLTHAAINNVALSLFLAALVIIEYNKFQHKGTHFESPHAILGLITYILLILQALVGVTQYFVPQIYGGVDNAKKIYKYHRIAGYTIFVLTLATVAAATQTYYNKHFLHIQLWTVIVASVITLAGVVPRIRLSKFGWLAGRG